ncbi:hypothetical protein Nepgr_021113 [Nepenthes gracilis]|uniref:Uncharacterized protein n=1 Tax=Nepenthes gracilis TaxID=150966 RepID=A0AAD3XVN7_NEPGR|nr:hypothetical protein Nepgr_021113 [Nepenthes gracilis]
MDSMYSGYYCYVVKPGVFAGAAILSLVCIALGILYHLTLTSGKSQDGQWSGSPAVSVFEGAGHCRHLGGHPDASQLNSPPLLAGAMSSKASSSSIPSFPLADADGSAPGSLSDNDIQSSPL